MTEPDGMYGEDIRHALSAVADLVVPTGDGLGKIRQRTRHRPPALAWLFAYGTYLPRALIHAVTVPGSELVLMAKGQSTLFKRMWAGRHKLPAPSGSAQSGAAQSSSPRSSSPQAWMRPVLAAGGALVIVVAVVLAVPRLHQTIITSSNNTNANASVAGHNGGAGGSAQTNGATRTSPSPGADNSGGPSHSPGTGKCAGKGSTGPAGSGIPPVEDSTPPMSSSTNQQEDLLHNGTESTTHCSSSSSSSPSPHTSSPTSPSSPSS